MQHLDLQVISQARQWLEQGEPVWLCTVLSTYGSSPREPGALLVARSDGHFAGSLSGGCVEEDFLERVRQGQFTQRVERVRYGGGDGQSPGHITLPCGGVLEVLVEKLPADTKSERMLLEFEDALKGKHNRLRIVALNEEGDSHLEEDEGIGPRVECHPHAIHLRVGPAARLIIAGASTVSQYCAEFASSLGFEVIVCDPREEVLENLNFPTARVEVLLPSRFIATEGHCHEATAIVALTHDPKIDDLALIEAVDTPAFYIGAMGSHATSASRAERLQRVAGLQATQIDRIHMPIGLALGSKTPAEIALAVVADVLRVRRGIARDAL